MGSEYAERQARTWRDRRHPVWLYRFLQILVAWPLRFFFLTRCIGRRKVPRRGPVILATNHASNVDPVLVVATMPRTIFHLAKHTLFSNWFTATFFGTLGGQIPVNRYAEDNRDALETAAEVLRSGRALGIYPEAARSPHGRLGRARTGVARIAFMTGAPIVPVVVDGTFRVWPKGQKLPRLFRRTRVIVGDPIRVEKDAEAAEDPRRCRELADRVMSEMAILLEVDYDPATAESF